MSNLEIIIVVLCVGTDYLDYNIAIFIYSRFAVELLIIN